jgi:hypothetical protein
MFVQTNKKARTKDINKISPTQKKDEKERKQQQQQQ